jgi:hypothetical protein
MQRARTIFSKARFKICYLNFILMEGDELTLIKR